MNRLYKLIMSGMFALIAAGSFVAPAQAAAPMSLSIPDISVLTTQVGERIAAVLRAQLAQAVTAPRLQRAARTASVVITESNAIVVVATRLPALGALAQAEENRSTRVRL